MPRPVIRDEGVMVEGFAALQRALARIEDGAGPELTARIKVIGEHVRKAAIEWAPRGDGRSGSPGRLEDSIKVSVHRRGASVYSTSEYGGVQNVGGKVGRQHQTLLKRADVSAYMIKAVRSEKAFVERETEALVQWLLHTFQEG